jgi:hypothetical protein
MNGRQRPGYERTLEDELDDLMMNMTPEQVFDFLFTAARAADEQERANAQQSPSMWARYRPLAILVVVSVCLMILSGGDNEPMFSLSPTPALTVRRETPGVGVVYYVSKYQTFPAGRGDDERRLESAVNNAAFEAYTSLCSIEHERREDLLRMSRAWLTRSATRKRYAKLADESDMVNCRERQALQERMAAHYRRQRT